MATIIKNPAIIRASGNKPKIIEEFIGKVNSQTETLSIALMKSPPGWQENGQKPNFIEYTLVLKGKLIAQTREEILEVIAGQCLIVPKGEWIKYSTPFEEGAEYIAICMPAFSPDNVNRDPQ